MEKHRNKNHLSLKSRILLFSGIIILSIICILVFLQKDKPDNYIPTNMELTANAISITLGEPDNAKKSSSNEEEKHHKELYSTNNQTGKTTKIFSSPHSLGISELKDNQKSIIIKGETYFVAYEYTPIFLDNTKKRKMEKGHIFKITKNAEVKRLYTTENIFVDTKISNENITIYEKIYLDETNIYPSYYKPYYLIEKIYDGQTIKQIKHSKITPSK